MTHCDCCVLEYFKQTNDVLFMAVANHQLAATFRHRNTSALLGCLEPTEVVNHIQYSKCRRLKEAILHSSPTIKADKSYQ